MQTKKINGLIEQLAQAYGWEDRLCEEKARSLFQSLLDEATAQTLTSVQIRNGILYARINNAAARNNLSYRLSDILQQINAALGTPLLREIRLA
ncbi:MAG: DUF721 domain-containing protein [Bacteroides sp.]|nr:DUF721 domain-containing protein [Bacteroides sp.]